MKLFRNQRLTALFLKEVKFILVLKQKKLMYLLKTEAETLLAEGTNNLVADVDVNLTTGIITIWASYKI